MESLRQELESLQRHHGEEKEAEARAFRLAARSDVSAEVFDQEVGLIRTKQRWLGEQLQRVQTQLSDVERYTFSEESVELLRQRLDFRLSGSVDEDKRFVLEAVGAKVIAQANRSWDLELQVPLLQAEPEEVLQTVIGIEFLALPAERNHPLR